MSERKNIDRLFQEKFKDFEAMPPEVSWANIEARLDEKKKRRVIPFWWKLSGVAAVFLLGFFISQAIYTKGGNQNANPIVNGNTPDKTVPTNSKGINKANPKNNNIIPTESQVAEGSNGSTTSPKANADSGKNNSSDALATTSDEAKDNTAREEKAINKKTVYPSKSVVAEKSPAHKRSLKNKSNIAKGNTPANDLLEKKQQEQLAQNTPGNNNKSAANKEVVQAGDKEKNKETQASPDKTPINLDDLKGNVNSKIATKEIDKKANDTAAAGSVATNELEKLLNEKESKLKQESKRNRWQLTSNVAPVFLGSVSGGSPIDSTLSKNSKSYNTNVGYGIGVSYAVNKKLSIRTGLNKVNMSYDTHDITFFTGIQAKTLSGVHPAATSTMIHVESTVANNTALTPSEDGLLPFESSFVHKSSGYLRQEMGYLEMPVEMTYNVLDKKFGLKIIGGFSTMFLQDNSIMIISENRDTLLGEANNLNDVHFSTNLGLGVKYSFLKSFEFNVEPTVKYQLNTYSSNAGNFKPYLFGIYSGVSYKF